MLPSLKIGLVGWPWEAIGEAFSIVALADSVENGRLDAVAIPFGVFLASFEGTHLDLD